MYLLYTLGDAHRVIKTVLFNHEITNMIDVGTLITLQILTLFSYFNMSKINALKRTNTLLNMLTPVVVLCTMTSCSLVDFHERFRLEYRLHWQERQKQISLPKCWCSHIRAYWVTKDNPLDKTNSFQNLIVTNLISWGTRGYFKGIRLLFLTYNHGVWSNSLDYICHCDTKLKLVCLILLWLLLL
jgi:hypothetical protein